MPLHHSLLFLFLLSPVLSHPLYHLHNNILSGPNVKLNIALDTHPLPPSTNRFKLTSHQLESNIPPSSHVRMGKGFAVVYGAGVHADQVLGIWGNGLKLVPVDRVLLPGVFKNVARVSKWSMEMAFPPSNTAIKLSVDAKSGMSIAKKASHMVNPCAPGRARQFLEVAVAYDHTFCALYGGDERVVSALVQSMVDQSNVAYKRDTCVQLVLVHIEANCNPSTDPYRRYNDFEHLRNDKCSQGCANPPCSPPSLMLRCFGTFWKNNRSNVHRDSAYLLTGFEDGTGFVGLAYIGASCHDFYAYGWIQGASFETFAHEVAHNLGATHDSIGIMRPGDIPNFKFSDFSVSEITKFINSSPFNTCIDGTKPKCDPRTCPANCSGDNKCITGTRPILASLTPCTPTSLYYCARKQDGVELGFDCPPQFGFVKRLPDPTDELVFCCKPGTNMKMERAISRTYTLERFIYRDPSRIQLYNNRIPDENDIEDVTLIQSEMVDCNSGASIATPTPRPPIPSPITTHSRLPSPSARPTSSPSHTQPPSPTTTPSRRPSLSARPTSSPSHTQNPSQTAAISSTPTVCNNTTSVTFSCQRPTLVTSLYPPNLPPLNLYFQSHSGMFYTWFEKDPSIRVRWAGRKVTKDGTLSAANLVMHFVDLEEGGERFLEESVDPFKMGLGCCDGLYVYVKVRVCNRSIKKCHTIERLVRHQIRCVQPCGKGQGVVMPFSREQRCPVCSG